MLLDRADLSQLQRRRRDSLFFWMQPLNGSSSQLPLVSLPYLPTHMPLRCFALCSSRSTGCRPDLTGRKDHPFHCNVCPMSYPMATQLCDHLERAHDIIRHPSLITPNKSLSVGLAADVNQP